MKSVELEINGVTITAHSDGSITKPFYRKTKRTSGSNSGNGYLQVYIGGRLFQMHRVIAQAFLADFHDFPQVDHVDNNGKHNDTSNLRMVTHQQNSQAKKRKSKGCSSKYRGVGWHRGGKRWTAYCKIDGKLKFIGNFDSEREAAVARDAYHYLHGLPKEGLNFPEHYS